MGASPSTHWTLLFIAVVVAVFLWIFLSRMPLERLWPGRLKARYLCSSLVVVMLSQASWYAWADYRYDRSILQVADRVIWYVPVTAQHLFEQMGISAQRPNDVYDMSAGGGDIDYPELDAKLTSPYNIVWLVAESWRADMLTPEIMPETWAFAQKSNRFINHYSGGNGTRMGMFSQFYGLYGSYWFDFLNEGRPPVLMELLRRNQYSLKAYTSSRFSYPEFDKTIFARLSDDQLQSYTEGAGWERDRKNVSDMLTYIESAGDPFFSFMFFESAHANYYFPPESVIAPDYLEDFNYLTVDIEENIERIRARYINATHHLDSQLGRVFRSLEESGKLDNTIVIVTGDHGEEFMEKGRWGHNSTFSQEQIRVPLLVHVPESTGRVHRGMTSHLDLPATVLALLGVDADPSTYSYGNNLLGADFSRHYAVVSDWHGNTLVTPDVKLIFSKKGASYADVATDLHDGPVDLAQTGLDYRSALGKFANELQRFYK